MLLGLTAAIVYGISDYLGGWAARSRPSSQVSAVAFAAGLPVAAVAVPVIGAGWSVRVLGFGVLAGVAAAVSIWLLYACLAIGPVSVLAPLAGVLASVVPVVFGLVAGHEHLGLPGTVALGVVIASAAALSVGPERAAVRLTPLALGLGVAAGMATGAYLVALAATPATSGAAPVVVIFATGTVLLGGAAGTTSPVRSLALDPGHRTDGRAVRAAAVTSGASQAVADVLAVVGIHAGHLAVMAALVALYPFGTMALAVILAGERPRRRQLAAAAVALAASTVLAVT